MALAPQDAGTHGNYLFSLLFHPGYGPQALRDEHDAWNRRHAQALKPLTQLRAPGQTPDRPLRIGYVSAFFRDHVVGRNLIPLLCEHDRSATEVYCYANSRINDEITQRFRQMVRRWRDITAMSDEDAAALIRGDGIDILVDTTLHMDGSRLMVFARRPAPVQVTFAGYPGSTGLAAMDYRLTDVHLDPPGLHDAWYVEKSWPLPRTFWCYDPLGMDLAVGPLPAAVRGQITFGCLNNFSKTNEGRVEALGACAPRRGGSRLLLLAHEGSHRAFALEARGRLGVDAARVEFVGYAPRRRYLELFMLTDISLDTVPYNGHMTSLDSLWMGVPVVTLVGNTVVGRAGLSQLLNLGLPELIAYTPEDFVAAATALALDLGRLQEMRRSLRERMERSPLMNARSFARDIESAYRGMWERPLALEHRASDS